MASLVGQQLKDTYDSLLKTSDNDALGVTYKEITDGSGNGSNLYLGTGGNVGIGTTSPANILHVQGASDGGVIRTALFENSATAINSKSEIMLVSGGNTTRGVSIASLNESTSGQPASMIFSTSSAFSTPTERMRIDSSGNVGIGATNPSGGLHVIGDTNSNGGELYLQVNNNNTTDNIGAITFGNNVDTSLSRILAGTSGANNSSYLTFSTSSTGSMLERMRIDSSGNVGIGTTSPDTKLHNVGTTLLGNGTWPTSTVGNSASRVGMLSTTDQILVIANTNGTVGANNGAEIYLGATATTSTADMAVAKISGKKVNATSGNKETYLSFSTSTSGGTITERMRIDSSGNVGIGTTSPAVELDVVGTIRGGIANKKGTYTDGDTTPSVAGISYLRIANTGATTITDFDDAVEGQVIYLEFADSNTTVNRSNAYLSGGTNFTSSANDMLVLFYSSSTGLWLEISRSVNS